MDSYFGHYRLGLVEMHGGTCRPEGLAIGVRTTDRTATNLGHLVADDVDSRLFYCGDIDRNDCPARAPVVGMTLFD